MSKRKVEEGSGRRTDRAVLFAEMVGGERRAQIVARNDVQRQVLVEGSFVSENFGYLQVEAGCTRELADAVATAPVKPRVILTIVLSGEVHFAYDGSEHVLKVNPQRQSRASTAQALAVNLRRLTVFRRQIRRGERDLSKVQLMFNPDWLRRGDSNDPLRRRLEQHLLGQHLASIAWQPDEQVLALCRALLDLRHEPDRLRRSLQAENLAHQVLWGFIRHIEQLPLGACEPVRVPRPLGPTARAIAWLEANLDQPLSVETAARATAMSTRALQRHFRRDTGLTVSDYVRGRRLEKVRDALHQEQISISEAAFLAGYNHTSNFITAFRRHFGVTPGELCNADLRADGAVRCTPNVAGLGGRDKSVS